MVAATAVSIGLAYETGWLVGSLGSGMFGGGCAGGGMPGATMVAILTRFFTAGRFGFMGGIGGGATEPGCNETREALNSDVCIAGGVAPEANGAPGVIGDADDDRMELRDRDCSWRDERNGAGSERICMLAGRRSAFAVVGEGLVGLDLVARVGLGSVVKMVVLVLAGGAFVLSVNGRENDVRTGGRGPKLILSRAWKPVATPAVTGNDACWRDTIASVVRAWPGVKLERRVSGLPDARRGGVEFGSEGLTGRGFTGMGFMKSLRGGSVRCSYRPRDLCDRFGSWPIVDVGLVDVVPSSLSTVSEFDLSVLSAAETRSESRSTGFD